MRRGPFMQCPQYKDLMHPTEEEKDAYAEYVHAWRDYVPYMTIGELPEVILFASEGRIPDEHELTNEILRRGHRLAIVREMADLSAEFDRDAPTGKIVICDEGSTYGTKGIEGYREFLLTYGRSLVNHRMKLVVIVPPRGEEQGSIGYGHLVHVYCPPQDTVRQLLGFWDRLVYPEYTDAGGKPHLAEV